MRPSISVTLEPGLERGVPWGRDLHTFVTSAAGHMMRTLQKPRKNRPSKRQVNHRRFLHNMIQRKFADIEAANQRLASALYLKDGGNKSSSTLHQSDRFLQDPDTRSVHADDGDVSVDSHEAEVSAKRKSDSAHLWKQQPATGAAGENHQSRDRQRGESVNHSSTSTGSEYLHHHERQPDPQTSPDLGPLSLDSADFSIQMFTDISSCMQAQMSSADVSESQWPDVMDLFGVGSRDEGGSMDVEAYLESICADDVRRSTNRSTTEDLHRATGECTHQHGRHGDEESTVNYSQNHQRSSQAQRQNEDAADSQFNCKPNRETDIIQNGLHASIGSHDDASEPQTYQQDNNPCLLASCEKYQNFTPFEGIAQSFTVPLYYPELRPVPIIPHEGDWLFTDILQDRKSPDC